MRAFGLGFAGLVLLAALLFFVLALAEAYQRSAVERGLGRLALGDDPVSVAAQQVRDTLGGRGFVRDLRRFAADGDGSALQAMRIAVDNAAAQVADLQNRLTAQRELAALEGIDSAVGQAADLLSAVADDRIAAAAAALRAAEVTSALNTGVDNLLRARLAEAVIARDSALAGLRPSLLMLAGTVLAIAGGGLIWLVIARLADPLLRLSDSVEQIAEGPLEQPVWGQTRRDEIGMLARGVERLRARAAAMPDLTLDIDGRRGEFRFAGPAQQAFGQLTDSLAATAREFLEIADGLRRETESTQQSLRESAGQSQDLGQELARALIGLRDLQHRAESLQSEIDAAMGQVKTASDSLEGAGQDTRVAAQAVKEESGRLKRSLPELIELLDSSASLFQRSAQRADGASAALEAAQGQDKATLAAVQQALDSLQDNLAAIEGLEQRLGATLAEKLDTDERTARLDALTDRLTALSASAEHSILALKPLIDRAGTNAEPAPGGDPMPAPAVASATDNTGEAALAGQMQTANLPLERAARGLEDINALLAPLVDETTRIADQASRGGVPGAADLDRRAERMLATVNESISQLNNVATALAVAGDSRHGSSLGSGRDSG